MMRSRRLLIAAGTVMVLGMGAGHRPSTAAVDMSRYVALGDSLTAGFAGGGLHRDAQLGGYARLLAQQGRAATVPFEQPIMTDPGIPAVLRLGASPLPTLAPKAGLGSPVNLTLPRPYDNLSVPGARAADVLRTSSDAGGLQDLVLRGLGTQLEQALLLEPTFVSLWVGLSDALGAALSGIVLDGVTLTPADRFAADFNTIVQSLAAGGVGAGVVATIPRVTDLPYVTTLATVVVDSAGAVLEVGGVPVPLIGPEGHLGSGDFVLLAASRLLEKGDGVPRALGGSGVPLPDDAVLSRSEAFRINERIDEYNRVIRRAAADVGFAVVEAAKLFEDWHLEGVSVGGERFTSRFPGGGLFSLDGVHPSLLGHGLLVNAFVEAINKTYRARIPTRSLEELASEAAKAGVPAAARRRFVFSSKASKHLRFGLGLQRPGRLLRLKQRARERSQEMDRRRRQRFELPTEPTVAERAVPDLFRSAGHPTL